MVPWIVGAITFTSLEAVAMVYSNVLRDHVNKVSTTSATCYESVKLKGANNYSESNINGYKGRLVVGMLIDGKTT